MSDVTVSFTVTITMRPPEQGTVEMLAEAWREGIEMAVGLLEDRIDADTDGRLPVRYSVVTNTPPA